MENSFSGESSFSGFDETNDMEEEEVNDEAKTEHSLSPSAQEKLFVEAVRKLSSYEHSLETLVKRFDVDEIKSDSMIQSSSIAERFQNSDAFADEVLGRTDLSAREDHSASGSKLQVSDAHQKYVKIQIPFLTAEIILRILDEDLDKNRRSSLKQAESLLGRVRQNLVAVKSLLQTQIGNSGRSQKRILKEINDTNNDMLKILSKLTEKLVEYEVQNLSELLVRSMQDETRLSKLANTPQTKNDQEVANTKAMVSDSPSRSKAFYVIIFCFVAIYFMSRLMMLYLERENAFLERAYT